MPLYRLTIFLWQMEKRNRSKSFFHVFITARSHTNRPLLIQGFLDLNSIKLLVTGLKHLIILSIVTNQKGE